MSRITTDQITELLAQDKKGRINRAMFQAFLDNPSQFVNGFSTTFDQGLGLPKLIQLAVGKDNLSSINPNITSKRFKLLGTDVRTVVLELAPFLDGETGEQAAKRLVSEGYTLENTGELAGFLRQHPAEVEKCSWIVALGEDSRWSDPSGSVNVPCALVDGASRGFELRWFDYEFNSSDRVIVSRPSK